MSKADIIIVSASASLEPYLKAAKEAQGFEAQLHAMGFEVAEEKPARKIGFLAAAER